MRTRKLFGRLAILAVATAACFVLALLVPAIMRYRAVDEPFSGASVMASPRDMLVVTQNVRLSDAPDLSLSRGMLYADGNATLGTPISRFVLDAPVFRLNVSGRQATAASSGMAGSAEQALAESAPLISQLLAFGYDALTIRRGTVNIVSEGGVSETLSEVEAEVSGRRKGYFSIKGSFLFRGQRLKIDTAVTQPQEKKKTHLWQLRAALHSAFLDAKFDGQADVAQDIQLTGLADLTAPSLRRVARWMSVPLANAEGLNATSIKGQFTWARNVLALEQAKVSIDANEGTGTLSLNLNAERPSIDGTLAFNSFNLAPYVEGLRPQTFGFERPSTSWSNLDLSFPLVRYVDTDLRLSAPRVAYNGFEMGRTAATLSTRGGKLLIDIAEMELGSASVSLQLSTDTNEMVPRYVLRGKVQNFDAAQSAAALLSSSPWSGKGIISLDVAGSGQAPGEILRALSGKASIQMAQGMRLPIDLKALRSLVKQGPVAGWPALLKGYTQLDALDLRLLFERGVATFDTMQARSGSNAYALSGTVKLADAEMDLRVAARTGLPQDRPLRSSDFFGADIVSLSGALSSPLLSSADDMEHFHKSMLPQ